MESWSDLPERRVGEDLIGIPEVGVAVVECFKQREYYSQCVDRTLVAFSSNLPC